MTSTARTVVTAKETFQILMEVSKLLNTGLDETTLAICVRLCESGANPEALAKVITELQRVKREETGKGQGDGGQ
ncbi:mitotic-spindle organizing protein 1 [Penaeus vannamei]|uniref:mitotic-spindle organizing protein 1-like n=1 Tax=Penaeus monodon TaxID=6687 RepID=UPI000F6874C6|nr:mitotic-spindle organizing protein 1-like [Penaeus vannamei]XP_037800205.1 mitotic-spindle organizing protein 1-like [Penaeus monodon]XP_042862127.1 mitotic-spindle organizing protein 1-like [Penaeus japonicus]